MKVTRYTQACVLLEDNGHKIIIDPAIDIPDTALEDVEAVLYTHQHHDHFNPDITKKLLVAGAAVYANAAVAREIGTEKCTIANSLDSFNVAGFTVVAYDMPHCRLPSGSEPPQNTGYAINSLLFHPGDSVQLSKEMELEVPVVALPIIAPDISFYDAYQLATRVKARQVIPIHYDLLGAKPEAFAHMTKTGAFEVTTLGNGESLQLA